MPERSDALRRQQRSNIAGRGALGLGGSGPDPQTSPLPGSILRNWSGKRMKS